MRDIRDKFYKTLELDDATKKILKWYREVKRELINEKPKKEIKNDTQI